MQRFNLQDLRLLYLRNLHEIIKPYKIIVAALENVSYSKLALPEKPMMSIIPFIPGQVYSRT